MPIKKYVIDKCHRYNQYIFCVGGRKQNFELRNVFAIKGKEMMCVYITIEPKSLDV